MKLIRLMDNYFGNFFTAEKIGFTEVDSIWTSKSNEQKSRLKVQKKHGFVRSLGFYRKVGKIAGFHSTVIRPKFGPINCYYFLKFTKNG
jgi:hypothetical protein